jgi:hypothetical protein
MANALYPSAKESLLKADIDLEVDDIRAILVDNSYTYSSSHDFLDDLTGTLGTAVALTGEDVAISSANATFDANDVTFTGISASLTVKAVILYKHTGTNLPLTTTGADINVVWSNGSSKIFAF